MPPKANNNKKMPFDFFSIKNKNPYKLKKKKKKKKLQIDAIFSLRGHCKLGG